VDADEDRGIVSVACIDCTEAFREGEYRVVGL
jgi:hypothetical protein